MRCHTSGLLNLLIRIGSIESYKPHVILKVEIKRSRPNILCFVPVSGRAGELPAAVPSSPALAQYLKSFCCLRKADLQP